MSKSYGLLEGSSQAECGDQTPPEGPEELEPCVKKSTKCEDDAWNSSEYSLGSPSIPWMNSHIYLY